MSDDSETRPIREAVGYCKKHNRSFSIEAGCPDCNAGR